MTSLRPVRRFNWSNLGKRVMSAFVLAPLALIGVGFGGWAFLILLAAAVALLSHEWSMMSAPRAPVRVAVAIAITVIAAVICAHLGRYELSWIIAVLAAGACAVVARGAAQRPEDAAFGVLYIAVPSIALIWLRASPQGLRWTILLLMVTWAADVGAFAVGSIVKGPKLWPRFSPNKTWSGFAGGLAAAIIMSVVVTLVAKINMSLPAAALMGLVGGLATMGGDLVESMLKRRFGVKDSGDLIPGHGGLLDRVDGLMFAILAVAAARLIHLWGWAA